jgi:hypothetical protein
LDRQAKPKTGSPERFRGGPTGYKPPAGDGFSVQTASHDARIAYEWMEINAFQLLPEPIIFTRVMKMEYHT